MSSDTDATDSHRPETAAADGAVRPAAKDAARQTPEILHGAARFAPEIEGASGYKLEIAEPEPAHQEPANAWMDSLQSLTVTIVVALFVITFLLQAFQVPSSSMENTLLAGDYVLVDKMHFGQGDDWGDLLPYSALQRGDIIVFRYPVHPAVHFVKRVIALPGDRVRLIHKRVFVNGEPLNESHYAIHRKPWPDDFRDNFPDGKPPEQIDAAWRSAVAKYVHNGELVVPPGSCFAMGDNRDNSDDSRYWGFVPLGNIEGRPLVIYFSLAEDDAAQGSSTAGVTLNSFENVLLQVWSGIRWKRTLRLVS